MLAFIAHYTIHLLLADNFSTLTTGAGVTLTRNYECIICRSGHLGPLSLALGLARVPQVQHLFLEQLQLLRLYRHLWQQRELQAEGQPLWQPQQVLQLDFLWR